jgi:hypothetical protein
MQVHTVYSSLLIVVVTVKSRRMKCVRYGAYMREKCAYRILVCKPERNKVGVLNKAM